MATTAIKCAHCETDLLNLRHHSAYYINYRGHRCLVCTLCLIDIMKEQHNNANPSESINPTQTTFDFWPTRDGEDNEATGDCDCSDETRCPLRPDRLPGIHEEGSAGSARQGKTSRERTVVQDYPLVVFFFNSHDKAEDDRS